MNGWTIDHVAIVVGDLEATLLLYTQTLGFAQQMCIGRKICRQVSFYVSCMKRQCLR